MQEGKMMASIRDLNKEFEESIKSKSVNRFMRL
jgi:hypothetical protein